MTLSIEHSKFFAQFLAATAALVSVNMPAKSQSSRAMCAAPTNGESRWVSDVYVETHTYGLNESDQHWIGSYGGLAATEDSLFLYDQLRPRIVHLSGDLEERSAFGRQGQGPGEFYQAIPITWIDDVAEGHVAFDGRSLVVYDRNDLTFFDPEGEPKWSARVSRFTLGRSGLVFLSPVDEHQVLFGLDSLATGSRHLQLWKVERNGRRQLLWQRAVRRLARDDRSMHQREARSYWARHRNCLVISDGGSKFVWVVDLATLQTDSITLPNWHVPKFGELSSDQRSFAIGGSVLPAIEPGLLWRWRGLIVDPDGHAWLRAWTKSRDELQVFVLSLASGESLHLNGLPGFPTAFGRPGVLYAPRMDSVTDEHYLVRFQAHKISK